MKKFFMLFMVLLITGAVCIGAAGVSSGSATGATIPGTVLQDAAVSGDCFILESPVLELQETSGDVFDWTNGFYAERPAVFKEVIPVRGCSIPAVSPMTV